MSFVRIWVHAVFTTKDRQQYLSTDIRHKLIEQVRSSCIAKDIFLDSVGGWSDHLHILISLGREQNISKVMMLIKGGSSHWMNKQKLLHGRFEWQDDYYAISVSESQVADVRKYIENQEQHHRAVPFDRELDTLQRITAPTRLG